MQAHLSRLRRLLMTDPTPGQYVPTSGLPELQAPPYDIPFRWNSNLLICETSQRGSGVVALEASGDIDAVTAPQFAAVLAPLMRSELHIVVLDLRRVTFLSTSGLQLLLNSRDAFRRAGCQLRLAGPSRAIARPLNRLHLVDRFDIHDDVSRALSRPYVPSLRSHRTAGGAIQ
jgi:anti-anti-sigma factor